MNYTIDELHTLQDKDLPLLNENNIRGGISSVFGDTYVKSGENHKILYFDANNIYGYPTIQCLPYDEIKFDANVNLQDTSNNSDDFYVCYFVESDLKYQDEIKEKTKFFHFVLKIKFFLKIVLSFI